MIHELAKRKEEDGGGDVRNVERLRFQNTASTVQHSVDGGNDNNDGKATTGTEMKEFEESEPVDDGVSEGARTPKQEELADHGKPDSARKAKDSEAEGVELVAENGTDAASVDGSEKDEQAGSTQGQCCDVDLYCMD